MSGKQQDNDSQDTTAVITGLSHEGRGIAHIDNKVTFIEGALPGEQVQFRYLKKHRQFNEAVATEISHANPQRVKPGCAHFLVCGGCRLQHLASEQQLQHKQAVLLEQIQHYAHATPQRILTPITGPIWGYRHKARLGVKYVTKKASVLVGFRELDGRYLADIQQCQVLHPSVGNLIMPLRQLIQTLHAYQAIAQVEVAVGEQQTVLILRHLTPLNNHDRDCLLNFATQHHIEFYLQAKGIDSITALTSHTAADTAPSYLHYTLAQYHLRLQFQATDFTQINPAINTKMIAQALHLLALNDNDSVLDLFSGLGNFALPMAKFARHVVGIEGTHAMVQRASMNARQNQLHNTAFYCADLNKMPLSGAWVEQRYTKILLDPPRTGAAELCRTITQFSAERIVYVSCNPATLARDSGILLQQGYRLEACGIIDMFPHTAHVESMALFVRNE